MRLVDACAVLRTLKLVDSGITTIRPGATGTAAEASACVAAMSKLETLCMAGNHLRDLRGLPPSLVVLSAPLNAFRGELNPWLGLPPRLAHLGLPYNAIEGIAAPPAQAQAPWTLSMLSVDLSHNCIADLPAVCEALAKGAPALRHLALMGNPCALLRNYRSFVVSSLPGLAVLDDVPIKAKEAKMAAAAAVAAAAATTMPESPGSGIVPAVPAASPVPAPALSNEIDLAISLEALHTEDDMLFVPERDSALKSAFVLRLVVPEAFGPLGTGALSSIVIPWLDIQWPLSFAASFCIKPVPHLRALLKSEVWFNMYRVTYEPELQILPHIVAALLPDKKAKNAKDKAPLGKANRPSTNKEKEREATESRGNSPRENRDWRRVVGSFTTNRRLLKTQQTSQQIPITQSFQSFPDVFQQSVVALNITQTSSITL
eukprot:m51a1_g12968 hypothetical protein (431) ;mRNA; f:310-2188